LEACLQELTIPAANFIVRTGVNATSENKILAALTGPLEAPMKNEREFMSSRVVMPPAMRGMNFLPSLLRRFRFVIPRATRVELI
jgi:hypothetical protein